MEPLSGSERKNIERATKATLVLRMILFGICLFSILFIFLRNGSMKMHDRAVVFLSNKISKSVLLNTLQNTNSNWHFLYYTDLDEDNEALLRSRNRTFEVKSIPHGRGTNEILLDCSFWKTVNAEVVLVHTGRSVMCGSSR
jgi:predicted neuraminidase